MTALAPSTKAKTLTVSNPFAGLGQKIVTAFQKSAEIRAQRYLKNRSEVL